LLKTINYYPFSGKPITPSKADTYYLPVFVQMVLLNSELKINGEFSLRFLPPGELLKKIS
jgi:hypothetical protein